MRKLKPDNQVLNHIAPLDSNPEEHSSEISTIIYNPLHGLDTAEYSDSSIEQRELYIKSRCHEAETVILTLSKMFEGEILSMEINGFSHSIACILRTHKNLTSKECSHILSISRNLQIT